MHVLGCACKNLDKVLSNGHFLLLFEFECFPLKKIQLIHGGRGLAASSLLLLTSELFGICVKFVTF